MRKLASSLGLVTAIACLIGSAGLAHAGPIIDFEGFSQGTVITDQYAAEGVIFGNDATILQAPYYNYIGYPPHSGTNVLVNTEDFQSITAASNSNSWTSVSAYYTTGDTDLELDAYNSSNVLIASVVEGIDYYTSELISLSAVGIAYVEFKSEVFTIDDFTYTASAVPEPGTLVMTLTASAVGLGCWGRQHRRRASRS
jgi:hypothetical protein